MILDAAQERETVTMVVTVVEWLGFSVRLFVTPQPKIKGEKPIKSFPLTVVKTSLPASIVFTSESVGETWMVTCKAGDEMSIGKWRWVTTLDAGLGADSLDPVALTAPTELPANPYEAVDHPKHYNRHPKGIECIDVIEEMDRVNVALAIKHLWQLGEKPGSDAVEDLKKAIWYLNREVSREQARRSNGQKEVGNGR